MCHPAATSSAAAPWPSNQRPQHAQRTTPRPKLTVPTWQAAALRAHPAGPLPSYAEPHALSSHGTDSSLPSFPEPAAEGPPLHAVTPLPSGPWPTRQTPARHLPSRSRPRVRDHAAWLVRSASPAHDQHPCAAVISVITFRVPLSLYKPRHRQSPFPST